MGKIYKEVQTRTSIKTRVKKTEKLTLKANCSLDLTKRVSQCLTIKHRIALASKDRTLELIIVTINLLELFQIHNFINKLRMVKIFFMDSKEEWKTQLIVLIFCKRTCLLNNEIKETPLSKINLLATHLSSVI